MNSSKPVIVVVSAAVLLIVGGSFSLVSGQGRESLPATVCSKEQIETLQWGDTDTDLASCQQNCRSKYGVDLYTLQFRGGGGSVTPGYYIYARCIENCNRKFWNNFDRKMDRLLKE